jgi:hypothetical protein
MIGSPALRDAVSSVGAGRAGFAMASAVGAATAISAASVTMAREFQRRIVTADCDVVNRFAMPFPVEMPVSGCLDQVGDRDFWLTKRRHVTPRNDRRVSVAVLP